MCTLNTTILDKTNSSKLLQFTRKIYIVHKKWPKIKYGKILNFYRLAKWQSMEILVLFHKCVYLTLPFWLKRFPENISSFLGKFTLYTEKAKMEYGKILKSYPLVKWPSIEMSVLFHKCIYLTPPSWLKRIPVHFSSFPGKSTLYTKIGKN